MRRRMLMRCASTLILSWTDNSDQSAPGRKRLLNAEKSGIISFNDIYIS